MIKKLLLSAVTVTLLFANESAEELLQKNCASCHYLKTPTPDMIPTFKAPAMEAVGFHLKKAYGKDEKKMIHHIVDFVLSPDVKKSVCESNKVAKFGVMPTLKGKISKEDLKKIAEYIVKNYPTTDFKLMIKTMLSNDEIRALQNSPFLVNSDALPHLTKMLIQNWDKGVLGLTSDQKKKLLRVRKETLSAVKKIKEKTMELESELVDMIKDDDTNQKEIDALLQKIAKLKIEATKVHIKCIKDTLSILNDKQIAYFLPFWEE